MNGGSTTVKISSDSALYLHRVLSIGSTKDVGLETSERKENNPLILIPGASRRSRAKQKKETPGEGPRAAPQRRHTVDQTRPPGTILGFQVLPKTPASASQETIPRIVAQPGLSACPRRQPRSSLCPHRLVVRMPGSHPGSGVRFSVGVPISFVADEAIQTRTGRPGRFRSNVRRRTKNPGQGLSRGASRVSLYAPIV